LFYLARNIDRTPIGQVRFDIDGSEALISISIERRFRGKGYGRTIIRLASKSVFDKMEISVINAFVKQDNIASKKVFLEAGFREAGLQVVKGYQAVHLVLRKDG